MSDPKEHEDEADEYNPMREDGVTAVRFKNYKPSIFEARGHARSNTASWRKKLQMSKVKFDDKAKGIFLEHYSRTSRLNHAAAAAGVCPNTVNTHRKNDPDFDAACEVARGLYNDDIHALAMKVANGVREPIFGGEFKDQVVGYKTVYHPGIIMQEQKRCNPEYRDKQEIDIKGVGLGALVVPATLTPAEWAAQAAERNADHAKEPGSDEDEQAKT